MSFRPQVATSTIKFLQSMVSGFTMTDMTEQEVVDYSAKCRTTTFSFDSDSDWTHGGRVRIAQNNEKVRVKITFYPRGETASRQTEMTRYFEEFDGHKFEARHIRRFIAVQQNCRNLQR